MGGTVGFAGVSVALVTEEGGVCSWSWCHCGRCGANQSLERGGTLKVDVVAAVLMRCNRPVGAVAARAAAVDGDGLVSAVPFTTTSGRCQRRTNPVR